MQDIEYNSNCFSSLEEGYDFVLPIEEGDFLKSITVQDEAKEEPDIMMVYPKETEVMSRRDVNRLIKEVNDKFQQKMSSLAFNLSDHNKSLADQYMLVQPYEEFVKVEIKDNEDLKQFLNTGGKGTITKFNDNDVNERQKEMKLLMEDFMRCSYNERFNWDERRSDRFETKVKENKAVESNVLVSMWTDDIKGVLKEYNDKCIATMEVLLEEIKHSNEMLVKKLTHVGEGVNIHTSNALNVNDNNEILDKAVQVQQDISDRQNMEEKQEDDKMTNEIYNFIEDIWEPEYPEANFEIIPSQIDGYHDNKILMDDFMTLSFNWREGILHSDEQSDADAIQSEAFVKKETGDEDLDKVNTIHACESLPLCLACTQNNWHGGIFDTEEQKDADQIKNITCVENQKGDKAFDMGDTEHTCESLPLCLYCNQNKYEEVSTGLQSSPPPCYTCSEQNDDEDDIKPKQALDKNIEMEKNEVDDILPLKLPPLKLTLAEKVKEMEVRRKEPFIIELDNQWIRMNNKLKKMVDEIDIGVSDISELIIDKQVTTFQTKLPNWLDDIINEEERITFNWKKEMENIKTNRQKEVMDATNGISFNQRFITMAYALRE